ncbi:MAG: prepilin-type N-terminal cleavage/methylation domain-containing protein [Syntrophorhabdaceae bacterium]|nr:prepilin-type N-terminal cleavage/methylation domain-containing protein [Syntrophorhabdaceae bacterium]
MWKNNKGLTLIEVMVSMVILFIFFWGINAGGLIVLDENIKNEQRDEAVSIAEETMLRMRNTPYVDLAPKYNNVTDNVFRRVRGKDRSYSIRRTVDVKGDLTELGVIVTWNRNDGRVGNRSRQYNHVLNTIVRR